MHLCAGHVKRSLDVVGHKLEPKRNESKNKENQKVATNHPSMHIHIDYALFLLHFFSSLFIYQTKRRLYTACLLVLDLSINVDCVHVDDRT